MAAATRRPLSEASCVRLKGPKGDAQRMERRIRREEKGDSAEVVERKVPAITRAEESFEEYK